MGKKPFWLKNALFWLKREKEEGVALEQGTDLQKNPH